MRILIASVGLLLPFSSVALAEPRVGQVIWSDIHYGMTKDQVSALHPKGQIADLGNGCGARVSPEFESKRVVEVTLKGAEDEVGCDASILASLIAKYGNPRTIDVEVIDPTEGRKFVGGGMRRLIRLRQLEKSGTEPFDTIRVRTWFTGDTLITLRSNETLREWSALYQPAGIKKPVLTDKI